MAVLNREYDSLVNVIQTDSIIMPSIDEITKSGQLKYTQVSSMVWDTGATNTLISSQVVDALELVPLEESLVEGVGGIVKSLVYEISLYLANDIVFKNVKALCSDIGDYDLVVGMDIIAQGDFVVSNNQGKICFSYRLSIERKDSLGALIATRAFADIVGKCPCWLILQILEKLISYEYNSKENSQLELDFVIQAGIQVIPVEVKAEENLQSKSLKATIAKYSGMKGLRFSMSDYREQDGITNVPLYGARGYLTNAISD